MIDIDNVISPHGEFNLNALYVSTYDKLPSELSLTLPMDATKKNMDTVMKGILKYLECRVMMERWNISKNCNVEDSKDFISYSVLQALPYEVIIVVLFEHKELTITFYYHIEDKDGLGLIQKAFKGIRNDFGIKSSPVFNVLSKSYGELSVEKIHIDAMTVDVSTNYNDNFQEIDQIIKSALSTDTSGLILLHGMPGTGKTTYIKSLLTMYPDKSFIFIPIDFVNELLKPDFVSFMIAHKNAVLVIEDAEKVIASREQGNRESVVSTILQLTDGLFSDYLNIKIICTFNTNIANIDQALLRKGRLIAFYEFKPLDLSKTNQLLEQLNLPTTDEPLTVSEIYNRNTRGFDQNKQEKIGFG